MRPLTIALALLVALPCLAQPMLPAEPGETVPLADDDYTLELGETQTLQFTAPEGTPDRQVVLSFRARIDAPTLVGSTNIIAVAVNGKPVLLRNARREIRLLNKPDTFAWSNPPELTWYIRSGQWRLVYAPDFEILNDHEYYGPSAYEFAFDISDLVQPGDKTVSFEHTGNEEVAEHAGCDLTVVFRDLALGVREGPGLEPGAPEQPDYSGPWQPRERRWEPIVIERATPAAMILRIGAHRYELTSEFSAPGPEGETQWLTFPRERGTAAEQARIVAPGWRLTRTLTERLDDGRLLVHDAFTSTAREPVGIRIRHRLRLLDGRVERVSFGGYEDPTVTAMTREPNPYILLPRDDSGVALVTPDDVLRNHASFEFDDANQTAAIVDDWFGLEPGNSYAMDWGVYATDTENDFDLINMLRADWLPDPFQIRGGYNFFEPDAILAYDDDALREHLEMLNINVAMSQGGWLDRKLQAAGTPNIGHGPIVASELYADYRDRLRQAVEKLHRLRPGIKCLIYYDARLIAGEEYVERYEDSIVRNADGSPRVLRRDTAWGMPLALVVPTLNSALGRDILEKIPTMVLDEIGADGLYWDEMRFGFGLMPDYGHTDGYTYQIDPQGGEVIAACGAPELVGLDLKLALLDAFEERGAMVVGNGPPGTRTEYDREVVRFCENMVPHRPSSVLRTTMYTPISYAGYSVYHEPDVSEADFLADIRRKIEDGNLYLFSATMFYHLFTHENLATYQFPITPIELDHGVIIGEERIITLREGTFGWPGEAWSGEIILFDGDQRVISRKPVEATARGLVQIELPEGGAAVIVRE